MPAESKDEGATQRRSSRKPELSSLEESEMKKKNFAQNSDEENEFDVDEPEEIQNNASDDDWTPEQANNASGRRMSSRLRSIPRSRAPIIDPPSSSDEEHSDDSSNKRKKGRRGRPPVKRVKVSSTSSPSVKNQNENSLTKSVSSDSEVSTTASNSYSGNTGTDVVTKDFASGAFIILKTDAEKLDEDPPIWKIDGKALLQKYVAFEQDGQKLYKNTSVYSGWTLSHKNNYYPVQATFKQQTRKEHVVTFTKEQIKMPGNEEEVTSPVTPPPSPKENTNTNITAPKIKQEALQIKQEAVQIKQEGIQIKQENIQIKQELVQIKQENMRIKQESIQIKKERLSEDEDDSDQKPAVMKPLIKVKSFAVMPEPVTTNTPAKPTEEKRATPSPSFQPPSNMVNLIKINKNYTSGSFLVLRTEASIDDPPLWKIDGKSLLQKYEPFKQNDKTLYKNTAEFSGWTLASKNNYFPASVIFKSQNKKDHIVALERIKWDEPCEDE